MHVEGLDIKLIKGKKIMDIKLVIFDFDGTLADTTRLIVTCKQEAMRQMGLEVKSEKVCASSIGLSAGAGFKREYPDLSDESIDKCVKIYRALFEEKKLIMPPDIFPGVIEILEELKTKGIICTIASSRNSKSLKGFLETMGLKRFFDYTLGGDDTELLKPNPDPVLKTLKDLNMSAQNTLVVGDMPFDVLMGKNAGTYTCGVTYGNADRKELEDANADFIIDNIRELSMLFSLDNSK